MSVSQMKPIQRKEHDVSGFFSRSVSCLYILPSALCTPHSLRSQSQNSIISEEICLHVFTQCDPLFLNVCNGIQSIGILFVCLLFFFFSSHGFLNRTTHLVIEISKISEQTIDLELNTIVIVIIYWRLTNASLEVDFDLSLTLWRTVNLVTGVLVDTTEF